MNTILVVLAFLALIVAHLRARSKHIDLRLRVEELESRLSNPLHPQTKASNASPDSLRSSPWEKTTKQAARTDASVDNTVSDVEEHPAPISAVAASSISSPVTAETIAKNRNYFVFSPDRLAQLRKWLFDNWFIVVAAVSLALAGIFFVQYGIENGLLPPPLRVLAAIAFGAALIAGGEFIRRRLGDDHDLAAFLPSAISGAGFVSIMAGILSARQLYDLIGPTPALLGIVATATLAIGLGWFYGPFLIAFGTIGATVAPFLVGGSSPDPWPLFYYFALISVMAMTVDAIKRTAWITVIAIMIPTTAAVFLFSGSKYISPHHFVAYGILLFAGSVVLPPLSAWPAHAGAMITETVVRLGKGSWPEFPTRIAFAGGIIAIACSLSAGLLADQAFWIALIAIALVFLAAVFWLSRAPALQDIAVFAGLAFVGLIAVSGILSLPVLHEWKNFIPEPEMDPPATLTLITALSLLLSGAAAYSVLRGRHMGWAILGGIIAPLTVVVLDQFWEPLSQLSRPTWALHAITVAAVMTGLATVMRQRAPSLLLLTAIFALAAMTMTAFACIILLSETALTLALAALAVSAAWLDRRFKLKPLTLYTNAAALTCSWRLVLDPGFLWAIDAPISELFLAFGGTSALLGLAWVILSQEGRRKTQMVIESVAIVSVGIGASLILGRMLENGNMLESFWAPSLLGIVWLFVAAAQYHRAGAGFQNLRKFLAGFAFLIASVFLVLSATILNPMVGWVQKSIEGPPIFDSLALAYLLPAILMFAGKWFFCKMSELLRRFLFGFASTLAALWLFLEIRRIWRGPDLTVAGYSDAEIYSHTIALILLAAGLIFAALFKKSDMLRRAGLAAAAIAVAKVFLIDISGLTGLTRVFSFLALGLSLAGLALVNRWIIRTQNTEDSLDNTNETTHSD